MRRNSKHTLIVIATTLAATLLRWLLDPYLENGQVYSLYYAAVALTTDTSFLTACANDYSFDDVFARQVEALGRRGDALLLLSTSGRSENVVRAARSARERGIAAFAFTGAGGGPLGDACDAAIAVPSEDPARIQEAHLLLGHALCGAIETMLGGFR